MYAHFSSFASSVSPSFFMLDSFICSVSESWRFGSLASGTGVVRQCGNIDRDKNDSMVKRSSLLEVLCCRSTPFESGRRRVVNLDPQLRSNRVRRLCALCVPNDQSGMPSTSLIAVTLGKHFRSLIAVSVEKKVSN